MDQTDGLLNYFFIFFVFFFQFFNFISEMYEEVEFLGDGNTFTEVLNEESNDLIDEMDEESNSKSDDDLDDDWQPNTPIKLPTQSKLPVQSKLPTQSKKFSDLQFLKIVNTSGGRVLFEKSQTPKMKQSKKDALKVITEECLSKHGVSLSEQQAKKKLENLKTRFKSKIDRKKTGNEPIHLNECDKLLSEMLDADENPSISKLKCKLFYSYTIVCDVYFIHFWL